MDIKIGNIVRIPALVFNRIYCIRKFNNDRTQVLVEPIEKIVDGNFVLNPEFNLEQINGIRSQWLPVAALEKATDVTSTYLFKVLNNIEKKKRYIICAVSSKGDRGKTCTLNSLIDKLSKNYGTIYSSIEKDVNGGKDDRKAYININGINIYIATKGDDQSLVEDNVVSSFFWQDKIIIPDVLILAAHDNDKCVKAIRGCARALDCNIFWYDVFYDERTDEAIFSLLNDASSDAIMSLLRKLFPMEIC